MIAARQAVLLACAGVLLGHGPARAEAPPRLLVLPVRGNWWLGQDERRILETRLHVALTRSRRLEPVAVRDLPAGTRRTLPADLGSCVDPACLRSLARAAGAARVLALELLDEPAGTVLFATVYEGSTGEAIDRRELPRPPYRSATRTWAADIARWILAVPAPGVPLPPEDPGPPPPAPEPLLALALAPAQEGQSEARALLGALADRLSGRGGTRLALDAAPAAEVTHRGLVTVEKLAVSQRPHHLHRYRRGLLAATLTITDTRSGAVIFSKHAATAWTTRDQQVSEQQVVNALVDAVVSQWTLAFDSSSVARQMRPKQRRAAP